MTSYDFSESLIGMTNLAKATGLSDHDQAFCLLLVALGIGDRHAPGGLTREQFLVMAGVTYDRCRRSLAAGEQS